MKFSLDIKKGKLDKLMNIKESDLSKLMDDHNKMYEAIKEIKTMCNRSFDWVRVSKIIDPLIKEIENGQS